MANDVHLVAVVLGKAGWGVHQGERVVRKPITCCTRSVCLSLALHAQLCSVHSCLPCALSSSSSWAVQSAASLALRWTLARIHSYNNDPDDTPAPHSPAASPSPSAAEPSAAPAGSPPLAAPAYDGDEPSLAPLGAAGGGARAHAGALSGRAAPPIDFFVRTFPNGARLVAAVLAGAAAAAGAAGDATDGRSCTAAGSDDEVAAEATAGTGRLPTRASIHGALITIGSFGPPTRGRTAHGPPTPSPVPTQRLHSLRCTRMHLRCGSGVVNRRVARQIAETFFFRTLRRRFITQAV